MGEGTGVGKPVVGTAADAGSLELPGVPGPPAGLGATICGGAITAVGITWLSSLTSTIAVSILPLVAASGVSRTCCPHGVPVGVITVVAACWLVAGFGVPANTCSECCPVVPTIRPDVSTSVTPHGMVAGIVTLGLAGAGAAPIAKPTRSVADPEFATLVMLVLFNVRPFG